MRSFHSRIFNQHIRNLWLIALCLIGLSSGALQAQGDGARFYWKTMVGTNAVPMIISSMGGNANPLDPSFSVIPEANVQAALTLGGYARIIHVGKRSGMVSVLLPMGRLTSQISINGSSTTTTARGYGDPLLQFGINVVGPKAIMGMPDMLRYKPGFSVDIIGSLALPIGEYDAESPINIGQNRWYGRIGAPVIWQIGPWVQGKRTTLELLPAVWVFGDNTDFVGETLQTDPLIQMEGHITRDLMERLWASLDIISYSGGKATIGGKEQEAISNLGAGFTTGYMLNDNMQMTFSYSSTINDQAPEDLNMDGFRLTFLYGWNGLVEGMHRLKSNE